MTDTLNQATAWDRAHSWHPFTQMREWCDPSHEPLQLVRGEGSYLFDDNGRRYLDGNSSIWTNLHGHRHPALDAALREQLDRVAHTSYLGSAHPPGSLLAHKLSQLWPGNSLPRVFFSDDGSTAIEVAIKLAAQFWQLTGQPRRELFLAFDGAYHGDTIGASSLGGLAAFHDRFARYHFPVQRLRSMGDLHALPSSVVQQCAAVVIEPLIQGAAGMHLWPSGMLRELREWCDANGPLLIADEVMTGFGRTGEMFACQHEEVVPDLVALAKGLTGGYLPLAATLASGRIFDAFLGRYEEMRTFFHGHSYTASQLGCAVALASLDLFENGTALEQARTLASNMKNSLGELSRHPHVREIRRCGTMAGIELASRDGQPFDWKLQIGARVAHVARNHGLLTRAIRDVIVLMPPYCTTRDEVELAVRAIQLAADEVTRSLA